MMATYNSNIKLYENVLNKMKVARPSQLPERLYSSHVQLCSSSQVMSRRE